MVRDEKLRRDVSAAKPAIVHAWGPGGPVHTHLLRTRSEDFNQPRLIASAASFRLEVSLAG